MIYFLYIHRTFVLFVIPFYLTILWTSESASKSIMWLPDGSARSLSIHYCICGITILHEQEMWVNLQIHLFRESGWQCISWHVHKPNNIWCCTHFKGIGAYLSLHVVFISLAQHGWNCQFLPLSQCRWRCRMVIFIYNIESLYTVFNPHTTSQYLSLVLNNFLWMRVQEIKQSYTCIFLLLKFITCGIQYLGKRIWLHPKIPF